MRSFLRRKADTRKFEQKYLDYIFYLIYYKLKLDIFNDP